MCVCGRFAQKSRDFKSTGFEIGTPVGDYAARRNSFLEEATAQTPGCEAHTRARADEYNLQDLETAERTCNLEESECGKSVVKYFCEYCLCGGGCLLETDRYKGSLSHPSSTVFPVALLGAASPLPWPDPLFHRFYCHRPRTRLCSIVFDLLWGCDYCPRMVAVTECARLVARASMTVALGE